MATAARDAVAVAERIVGEFNAAHCGRVDRDMAVVRSWMEARSVEICGAVTSRTLDLFEPEAPDEWRSRVDPEERLAGLSADPSVVVSRRREAAEVLKHYRSVSARGVSLPPVSARMLGMLLLVP
jgi:hypothetical protein